MLKNISNIYSLSRHKLYFNSKSHFSTINEILSHNKPGDKIRVKGWIKSLRNQKENVFIDVSDGSTCAKLQIFIPKTPAFVGVQPGTSIQAEGCLSLSPRGQIELAANSLEILGKCSVNEGYPFAPRKHYAAEYIRQHLHLRPRTNKFGALLRVRSAASLAIYNFLSSEGFTKIDTPILTSNDCEGAGEVFKVIPDKQEVLKAMIKEGQSTDEAYFNAKTFLTVSGQLHLETAAHGLGKVYTFGPTFRAENSRSRVHLSEFYMLEAEVAFIENVLDIIQCVQKLVKNVTESVLNFSNKDVEVCQDFASDVKWLDKDFPIITYDEAQNILLNNQDQFVTKFSAGEDLAKEHELFLVQHCGNLPVFLINWPTNMKPFYMKEIENDKVAAFDLLGPTVGEIVGGSLRENLYDRLKEKTAQNNVNLDWYLDLRKFGSVPTAGFGLGFERFLQCILGISNIKDTIPFPRWPHNCSL